MLLFSLVLLGILLRLLTCTFDYSGKGKPPMFGDYEAQRHWMEITINLPVKEWYNNTKDNDLMYWGLDYPPLTAYHSWACGWIARLVDSDFVALHASRGFESPEHKLFMRGTVLISDCLVYMLGALLFHRVSQKKPGVSLDVGVFIFFVYPGFILIDHGHFQYNCVALGLVLLAYVAWHRERFVLGCVAFCLALNFKQMTLYYALPAFVYLLAKCKAKLSKQGVISSVALLVKISLTVIITFVICWLPFLSDLKMTSLVFRRIFPFERGIFEDKVANFWLIVNTVYKIRDHYSNNTLALLCATVTLLFTLPSCLHLFLNPTRKTFRFALLNSSLAFFLFSYHVHEKTILFVALPALMSFEYDPLPCFWFLVLTTFSMLPLLLKDGLLVPCIAISGLFFVSIITYHQSKVIDLFATRFSRRLIKYLFTSSMLGLVTICICSLFLKPPARYPDFYPVIISLYSGTHFLAFLLYFNVQQFRGLNFKTKTN